MSGKPDLRKITDAAARDIIELQSKIEQYKKGQIQEERFKHFRLTRGVYGQRQTGVHMFRTKIPYGKLNCRQLIRLADVSEEFTNGNLHLTTRQNVQMHYIKLNDATALWTELAEANITAREACGNTVRNLTASAIAGIDPDELFDVSPYVHAVFEYFLRNPICQEMGRKIKIAFSSSDKDSAFTYFHDFGFIPRIRNAATKEIRGFKVVVGGGLGAQSVVAHTAYEFLEADQIIPFMEAAIRVFDRYGEREKRFKARLKFLIKGLGFETFMELVDNERIANKNNSVDIDQHALIQAPPANEVKLLDISLPNPQKYNTWLNANVFEQKQKGFFAARIKVHLGDINAETARLFAQLVQKYAADDIRISVNQGIVLRFIRKEYLPYLFNGLDALGLGEPGFDTLADITACPGTDTCNLGVTNSTALSTRLEEVVKEEYPHLINESNIKIKISGCMNSCGQHMAANIGFHGSSIKKDEKVIPAMQVVIGGGVEANGEGYIAEKVIKLPTRRIPEALRWLLNDYESLSTGQEYFNEYFRRQGKRYFYDLLKPLADTSTIEAYEFFDWGEQEDYQQAIGVGECAGVAYDVIGTIITDAEERIGLAEEALLTASWADSIYHSYSAFVIGAKALLLAKDVSCNTQIGIIKDFDTHYIDSNDFQLPVKFADLVLKINQNEPGEDFAHRYLGQAQHFFKAVLKKRRQQLGDDDDEKQIIDSHYRA